MHSLMVNYTELHCGQTHAHVQTFSLNYKIVLGFESQVGYIEVNDGCWSRMLVTTS